MNQQNDSLNTAALGWWEIADALWLAIHRGTPDEPRWLSPIEHAESPIAVDSGAEADTVHHDEDRSTRPVVSDVDSERSLDLVVGLLSGDDSDPGLTGIAGQCASADWMWSKVGILPGELALGRAMRPLQKYVPSR